jgi:hypothetical protein
MAANLSSERQQCQEQILAACALMYDRKGSGSERTACQPSAPIGVTHG